MSGEKFVGKSRAMWAALLPALAVLSQTTGLGDEVLGRVSTVVEGLLGAAGAIAWLLHHFWPDDRRPVARPAAGTFLLVLLAIGLAVPALPGCVALGKKDASIESQFYEADGNAIIALRAATAAIKVIGAENLPPTVRSGLETAITSLRAVRKEGRRWVDACAAAGCGKSEKISLTIESVLSLTALVTELVGEITDDGEG